MSDPPKADLAARLQLLRDACVVKARFNDEGELTFVEFGALDGGQMPEAEEEKKPNPVREAALRLARPQAPAQ